MSIVRTNESYLKVDRTVIFKGQKCGEWGGWIFVCVCSELPNAPQSATAEQHVTEYNGSVP